MKSTFLGELLIKILCGVAVLIIILLFIEIISIQPHGELEPATVRKVIDAPWVYVGTARATLVKFDDGFSAQVSGDRGEPGERILAYRRRGNSSAFGIFATPTKKTESNE